MIYRPEPALTNPESEASARATLEHAPVGIGEVSLDGHWIRVNRRLCEITGYTQDELLGLTFSEITHPDDLKADLDRAGQLLSGLIGRYSLEKRYLRKDGSAVWVNLSVALVRDGAEPRYFAAVIEDIGARKRVEALSRRLTQAKQDLQALTFAISHDLRDALHSLQDYAAALIEEYEDSFDELGREHAQRIIAGAARMEEFIRALVDYSRIAGCEVELRPLPLGEIVDDALRQFRIWIEAKGAIVEVRRPLGHAFGDGSLLTQAVSKLIGNALTFLPPGTKPHISVWTAAAPEAKRLRLWVRDNGIGVAPEHRERIFQIFQRAYGSAEYRGTGIGLALVQKGLERLSGACGVEPAPGGGSCFWIELPAAKEG